MKKSESSQYDVLLVEDDLGTIRLLTSYFESKGVTCKAVISGTKGFLLSLNSSKLFKLSNPLISLILSFKYKFALG